MEAIVYTFHGKELERFAKIDHVREYEGYYELIPEGDEPRPQIYNKTNVTIILR